MIVPRFTSFTQNFVICSNQVTNMFRSGHDCTSTSSARSHCYFWSSSVFHNVGPSESACRHFAHPNPVPLLLAAPLEVHEMACKYLDLSLGAGFPIGPKGLFSSTRISLNSCSQSGNSCDISLCTSSDSTFFFCFRFLWFHAAGFPEALHSYFHFFLVLDFQCIC